MSSDLEQVELSSFSPQTSNSSASMSPNTSSEQHFAELKESWNQAIQYGSKTTERLDPALVFPPGSSRISGDVVPWSQEKMKEYWYATGLPMACRNKWSIRADLMNQQAKFETAVDRYI